MKIGVVHRKTEHFGGDSGVQYVCRRNFAERFGNASASTVMYAARSVRKLPFTITLDAGSGSCAEQSIDSYVGDKIGTLPECTKAGWKFDGWFDDSGNKVTASSLVSNRYATIYARYTEPTIITLDAGSGSCGVKSITVYRGYEIGPALPNATGAGSTPDFFGWKNGSSYITRDTVYDGTYTSLTASYGAFANKVYAYTYSSSNKKVGIYSATRYSSSEPIVVSWGDGTYDYVNGNISKLVHEYASSGVYYTIGISDNISTVALSANESAWYGTTTYNRYNIRRIISLSSKITSLPAYAFYYLQYMQVTNACITDGMTSIPSYCFYYCNYYNTMGNGSITIPKKITSIGSYAFRYCYYLTSVSFEDRSGSALTLNTYCFGGINYYTTGTITIPEGVTSIPSSCFYYSRYLNVVIPSTVTSIGSSAFYYCGYTKTIRINRSTAPTIQSNSFGTGSYTVGYNTRTSGTNYLYVPVGATGYDTSNWTSYLLNSSYGGFAKVEV